jgi:cell division protein FtsB
LEFSFDRSNDSQSIRNSSQNAEGAQPTSGSTSVNSSAFDDGVDPSTIANERLRKAIERNRARQAERNRNQPQNVQAGPLPRTEAPQQQTSFFDRPEEQVREEIVRETPPQRPRAQERAQERTQQAPEVRASTAITRRAAARPNEAEFTPIKRAPRKVSSQISYATSTNRKKSKSLDPAFAGYLVKGSWIFCAIMVLRLIFANGGVTDYYSNRSVYNDRLNELDRIKKENMQLVHEIERMQSDSAFQKKLVRDNLGFIASDEFLILFPKEKSIQ